MSTPLTGTLIIKPVSANLLRSSDFFTRMDPYVKVTCGSNIQKTSVAHEAGKHPSWTDTISLKRTAEDIILFEVWDYDRYNQDDLIGQGELDFSTILTFGGLYNDWISLRHKGKNAGQLLVNIQFVPDLKMMKQDQIGMGIGLNVGYPQPILPQPGFHSTGYQPLIQSYPIQQPNLVNPGYTAPTSFYPQNLLQTPFLEPQQLMSQQQIPNIVPTISQMAMPIQSDLQQFPGQKYF